MKQLILASASPRRKELLHQLGLNCKIVPPHYEAKLNPRLKPKGQAESLAKEKAGAVAQLYAGQDVVVMGFEKIIEFQGERLGRAKTVEDASRMLARLSGKEHTVITAFSLIDTASRRSVTKSSETTVQFRKLSKRDIDAYIDTGEPLDQEGCYVIDRKGATLIERIEGDFYTIVGIPLAALSEELKRFSVSLF